MKKILILNLTRIGDLIQTTPLMAGMKENDPSCEITLLGNVKFVGICEHIPNIDRLKVFDARQFYRASDGETSVMDVYRYLDGLVSGLEAEKYDMLVNLSHSKLTSMLGRMTGIGDVRGFCATEDGHRIIADPWLEYFTGFLHFRKYNTFNLVDLYQLGGGVLPAARGLFLNHAEAEEAVKPLLAELGISDGEKTLAVQAGASLTERRWPPSMFAAAADAVSERHGAKVLLLGAEGEKELVGEVATRMKRPAINLAGKTSLKELVGLVKRCFLLVTNDTATMHVAAAVGTPSVALFLVHAYPPETGPYCEGSVVLEPDIPCFPCAHNTLCPHYACLEKISPADVAAAAELALAARGGRTFAGRESFPSSRARATCFDEYGFWDTRPLKREQAREHEVLARMYRRFFMNSARPGCGDDSWAGYLEKNFEPWPEEKARRWAEREIAVFRKISDVADEGIAAVKSIERDLKGGKIANVKRKSEKLLELDLRITNLGHAHEELMPVVRLFQLGKENMREAPVEALLAQTKPLYRGIADCAAFVSSLVRKFGRFPV